jgi:hypothetical protein
VAFLEEGLAAFGSPAQIRSMVQARLGLIKRLGSNVSLAALMNAGSPSLVRGVATGSQIQAVAASAFDDISGLHMEWSALSANINLFAYSVNLDSVAHVNATLQCKTSAIAFLLKQMLGALGTIQSANLPFQNLQVSSVDNVIELKLDTPVPGA